MNTNDKDINLVNEYINELKIQIDIKRNEIFILKSNTSNIQIKQIVNNLKEEIERQLFELKKTRELKMYLQKQDGSDEGVKFSG